PAQDEKKPKQVEDRQGQSARPRAFSFLPASVRRRQVPPLAFHSGEESVIQHAFGRPQAPQAETLNQWEAHEAGSSYGRGRATAVCRTQVARPARTLARATFLDASGSSFHSAAATSAAVAPSPRWVMSRKKGSTPGM